MMITMQALKRQRLTAIHTQYSIFSPRSFSTSPAPQDPHHSEPRTPTKPHSIDPRWLTTMKRRIGRCMTFGLTPPQVQEAGNILQRLARDWRELIIGSEGYLTDKTRRGLYQHNVVWGEMDAMSGHVNNVTYVRYAETGRTNFLRNFAVYIDPAHKEEWMNLPFPKGIGIILRSIKIDYKFPMTYPDKISVYHKLAHDPSSSDASQNAIYLEAVIVSEARQRPAARVHENSVMYDYKVGKKTTLPPFVETQFKFQWELQEQAKKHWRQQILDIEAQVRTLETESWDREDAVEDTGSAKK